MNSQKWLTFLIYNLFLDASYSALNTITHTGVENLLSDVTFLKLRLLAKMPPHGKEMTADEKINVVNL